MISYAKIKNAEVANIFVAGEDFREDNCVRIPDEFDVLIGDGYDGIHFLRNGQPMKTRLEQMEEMYIGSQQELTAMTEDALDIADALVNDDIELELYRAIYGPIM